MVYFVKKNVFNGFTLRSMATLYFICSPMKVLIRKSVESDMVEVIRLIHELASFEEEPNAVEIDANKLVEDGFTSKKLFQCFVAEVENAIVGMALIYPRYSTWKGSVLHLEDLIVTEKFRSKGVGTKLLTAVIQYGHQLGVKRISWEVIDWNEGAIKFYESKGAKVMRDWDVVQLSESGIKNYLDKHNSELIE